MPIIAAAITTCQSVSRCDGQRRPGVTVINNTGHAIKIGGDAACVSKPIRTSLEDKTYHNAATLSLVKK